MENLDLVKELYNRLNDNPFPNFSIQKISGHKGNIGNELADALATYDKNKLAKIYNENKLGIASKALFDKN